MIGAAAWILIERGELKRYTMWQVQRSILVLRLWLRPAQTVSKR
jgi:hypothetical protein